jgi:hypothetical protein
LYIIPDPIAYTTPPNPLPATPPYPLQGTDTSKSDTTPPNPLPATPPYPSQGTDASESDSRTAQPSPSAAPRAQHMKRPLTPSSSATALPARTKRPRNLAYPPAHPQTLTGSEPVGNSKQAVAKRKANERVNNGTFVHDPKRWGEYKKKLAQLDPNFEVSEDPRLARHVKHSICGGWFVMAAPYEKERFKKHAASCSYSTGAGAMKSLESFGIRVISLPASKHPSSSSSSSAPLTAPSPVPTPSSLPCPGLTEKDSEPIGQYFTRTSIASAGGQDLHSIARDLFSDEFKNLSSEKKDQVRLKQKQTHTWSVDHLMKTVHAIGKVPCEVDAQVASDGSVGACKACKGLLTSHAFKKAISRTPAPNKNRAYIPHIYQPVEIGKMYSLGFNDLVDGVSAVLNFWTHRKLIGVLILDIES